MRRAIKEEKNKCITRGDGAHGVMGAAERMRQSGKVAHVESN